MPAGPRQPGALQRSHHAARAVFVVLVVCYAGLAGYYCWYGRVNHDEGWYLYAARLIYEGRLPYRDFAFFQAPFLPLVYGAPLAALGGGLLAGRLTSFVLSCLTVTMGVRLSRRHGGTIGATLFLAVVCLTPDALWAFTTTRSEPLSAFLWTLSAYCLFCATPRPAGLAIAGVAAVLAAATRVSSLPAAVLVLVWVLLRHRRSPGDLVRTLLPPVLLGVVLLAWMLGASTDVLRFSLYESHALRHVRLGDAPLWSAWDHVEARLRSLAAIHTAYGVVPLIALCCGLGLAAVVLRRRAGTALPAFVLPASRLAALGLVVFVPNLLPRSFFAVYFAGAFPLLVVLIAWCAGQMYTHASAYQRRLFAGALAGAVLMQSATYAARYQRRLSGAEPDVATVREAGRYLADVTSPQQTLVTMDAYLAVESGLRLAPRWEMDLFSFFPRMPEADARRYHVLSEEAVMQSLADPSVGAVALSDRALGVLIRKRLGPYAYFRRLSEAELQRALPPLRRYRLARVFPDYGQFRDRLYVLLPR